MVCGGVDEKDPIDNMQLSSAAKKALNEMKKNEAAEKAKAEEEAKAKAAEDAANGVVYEEDQEEVTDTAGGFTFSGGVRTIKKVKAGKKTAKKGYCRLVTTMGNLNLELDCDLVRLELLNARDCLGLTSVSLFGQAPKTCENFLALCEKGYYRNVIFHRLIKNFMAR